MTKIITLKKPRILIPLILALLASAILGGVVVANGNNGLHVDAVKFSSEGTITGVIDPGETTVDEDGNTSIRGMILQQLFESDSKYLGGGLATIVVNAELDPTGSGPDWGTAEVEIDNGERFQGGWTGCPFIGNFVAGQPFDFASVCHGTGDFEGMIMVGIGTREIPGGLSTVDQFVVENKDLDSWGHILNAHGDD